MSDNNMYLLLLWEQVNLDTSQTDAPRVADLKFQLEKRENNIADLEATVDKLSVCIQ